jgi:hypothetical protein
MEEIIFAHFIISTIQIHHYDFLYQSRFKVNFRGAVAEDFSRNVKRWISSENYDMTDLKVPLECLFEVLLSCSWKLFSNHSCSSSILVQSVVQTAIARLK